MSSLFPFESLVSSSCAAFASCAAKLAFDFSETSLVAIASQKIAEAAPPNYYGIVSLYAAWPLRGVMVVAMILLNSLMLKYYVDAMKRWSALQATVLNFALNFLLSALVGNALFGEHLPFKWWLGASLITCGVFLISTEKIKVPERPERWGNRWGLGKSRSHPKKEEQAVQSNEKKKDK
eukprot:GDKI01032102.1.p2 GENE.GDKI01032102.1~~GDKI01032102.1.p2  ORF type:complete len:179 (+),score=53.41 GDKI01032102.1:79-615(+)